ncbi:hypothetical protein NEI02_10075 [Brachyspira pilosicoli]|uniref:Macro domain-containing protein n=1 Tax=Brachyspira pilosicoli TaxID=52584 RepID=A0AAJ6KBI1_BRAPL|nr:hypothetical protein [Brachyspira pilosicoli]WIH90039.1 hypothetical protein NEI02_10075 [Brachyspira pilosicoli]WIH92334.1 hypothetical protein NEI01_10075 [Brachyspira pilosicoli]WIH94626.1 hypothetical protein NEH99_10070 [Brachyspira pilosicoli]
MRVSAKHIDKLEDDEVFVFGSNTEGMHAGGAARMAMNWGAIYGKAFGLQGKTFAIPTVDYTRSGKMSIDEIKKYVDEFLDFTIKNKDKKFLVTEIGCGIAGFQVSEIAPLFRKALEYSNVYLPERFINYLKENN